MHTCLHVFNFILNLHKLKVFTAQVRVHIHHIPDIIFNVHVAWHIWTTNRTSNTGIILNNLVLLKNSSVTLAVTSLCNKWYDSSFENLMKVDNKQGKQMIISLYERSAIYWHWILLICILSVAVIMVQFFS